MLGLLVPGVAHAAPPPNDDFSEATPIASLPFTTTQSTVEATPAYDDPADCHGFHQSVWFTYTASADGVLVATTAGSDYDTILAVHTGYRGALTQVACDDNGEEGTLQSRVEIPVVAGTTYHLMVSSYPWGSVGSLTLGVAGWPGTPPPANDAFARAERVTSLPHTADASLAAATEEPGEPESRCGKSTRSLWYAVTLPETTAVIVAPTWGTPRFAVYTGSELKSLTEVTCAWNGGLTFSATGGTTYYLRVADVFDSTSTVSFSMAAARPIRAGFSYLPSTPSTFTDVGFTNTSTVPDTAGPVAVRWDFGDGTTSDTGNPRHRYAVDGDYTVTLTVTAEDGRTGTASQVVRVRTHDIAITRFATPAAAAVGETKRVTVRIGSTRYAEDVTVTLHRATPSGWSEVGRYAQYVPASATGGVAFPFNYTFRPDDAALGKVNFRAVATLAGTPDAQPLDNEAISATTAVQQPAFAAVRQAVTGLDVA
ncbi:PKD domain-containing protein [Saccharothrix carnea]|uniref:PKD domain-containing protein n=1 Tax=Saccharothrix carnea TaxID=1280637 RepID=A0A2P8IJ24_SACCR|nr:PKD domain-containing protein [Saccharothrix carnea]PSL58441.1 PKD domain-containing protein [Saccharothrix carnea]